MPNIGPFEIIVVLAIVLLIFGPKKLPDLGRSLGSGMREFKDSITGGGKNDDDDDEPSKITAAAAKAEAKSKAKADEPDDAVSSRRA